MIAALYVDPRGPYFGRPDVDAWDKTRDARNYDGPYPVVAHPPCGPWGQLAHLYKGDDQELALIAVRQVRQFGGVLEHPANSRLWAAACLPHPGDSLSVDPNGYSIEVEQVSWGHVARKKTWLYLVGIPRDLVVATMRRGGSPTHQVSRDVNRAHRNGYTLKRTSQQMNLRTPPAFADWLIMLAESTRAERAAS